MSSLFDDVFSESGLPGVIDTLGESVTFRFMLTNQEVAISASYTPEVQEEFLTDDRERRISTRKFTFAASDVPNPAHKDEIDLGTATYVIDRIEHKSGGMIRVNTWRKQSVEKNRRGQRGQG